MRKSIALLLSTMLLASSLPSAFAVDNPCMLSPNHPGCPAWCGYTPNLPQSATLPEMATALNNAAVKCKNSNNPANEILLQSQANNCMQAESEAPLDSQRMTYLVTGQLAKFSKTANSYEKILETCYSDYSNLGKQHI